MCRKHNSGENHRDMECHKWPNRTFKERDPYDTKTITVFHFDSRSYCDLFLKLIVKYVMRSYYYFMVSKNEIHYAFTLWSRMTEHYKPMKLFILLQSLINKRSK